MLEQISLAVIKPNPYQTRSREDPEHVRNLAISIAEKGLLQIPTGRMVDGMGHAQTDVLRGNSVADLIKAGWYVQLAFGHSRLAAYKWLQDVQPNASFKGDWGSLPVNIQELSDSEMFEMGIAENRERKNLTPIEEARAMIIYRDQFGKNSIEIGSLFHLSDSGVRNKMRLLKLPENIQADLERGDMTEGQARALIPLYDVPEEERQEAEDKEEGLRPSVIEEAAKSGVAPEQISEQVKAFTGKGVSTETVLPTPEASPVPVRESASAQPVRTPSAPTRPAVEPVKAKEEPAKKPEPEPAAAPAPTTAPAAALTWEQSTVTVALTYWPEDGNARGRMVLVTARLNTGVPLMHTFREVDINLPEQVVGLMNELQAGGLK